MGAVQAGSGAVAGVGGVVEAVTAGLWTSATGFGGVGVKLKVV